MKTILIDTDIGDDIDDAIALVFAAKSGKADIAGVTTVWGDTEAKAKIAMHLLHLCGKDNIPVVSGMAGKTGSPNLPVQYVAKEMEGYCPQSGAVEFLIGMAAKHPDCTIITLGPFTNLAACIKQAPEIMANVELIIMGGYTAAAYPEWNIAAAPEASAAVMASSIKKTVIGLDVTLQCEFSDSDMRQILGNGDAANQCLYRMLRLWKRDTLSSVFRSWGEHVEGDDYPASSGMHDPMTVAYAFWPELFQTKDTALAVETAGTYARGLLLQLQNPFRPFLIENANARLAVAVDEKALMEAFLSVISR